MNVRALSWRQNGFVFGTKESEIYQVNEQDQVSLLLSVKKKELVLKINIKKGAF